MGWYLSLPPSLSYMCASNKTPAPAATTAKPTAAETKGKKQRKKRKNKQSEKKGRHAHSSTSPLCFGGSDLESRFGGRVDDNDALSLSQLSPQLFTSPPHMYTGASSPDSTYKRPMRALGSDQSGTAAERHRVPLAILLAAIIKTQATPARNSRTPHHTTTTPQAVQAQPQPQQDHGPRNHQRGRAAPDGRFSSSSLSPPSSPQHAHVKPKEGPHSRLSSLSSLPTPFHCR